jgi:hypothetical protein
MREIRQSGSEGGAKLLCPYPYCSPGAGRILESVSLWSNEEARSADKIIAWAVRPRETSPYRSSAEGAVEMVALLSRAISTN